MKTVSVPPEDCLECLANLEGFMSKSRYTYALRRVGEDVYEVVFRWRKLGIEKFYRVTLAVARSGSTVEYRSTPDSPYHFRMTFKVEPAPGGGASRVVVEAEMRAGLMASLMGRGDFREFVEELVDRGIANLARLHLAAKAREALQPSDGAGGSAAPGAAPVERPSCLDCVLYDPERRYCYMLRRTIENPGEPPCGGTYFIARPRAAAPEPRATSS